MSEYLDELKRKYRQAVIDKKEANDKLAQTLIKEILKDIDIQVGLGHPTYSYDISSMSSLILTLICSELKKLGFTCKTPTHIPNSLLISGWSE